jgi:predicted glycosyl hydrolase (DUF1957 family)
MTAGDWRKMLKQFAKKPAVRNKFIKHNKQRTELLESQKRNARDVEDLEHISQVMDCTYVDNVLEK